MLPCTIHRVTILTDANHYFESMGLALQLFPELAAVSDEEWHLRREVLHPYSPTDVVLVDDAYPLPVKSLNQMRLNGATVIAISRHDRDVTMTFGPEPAVMAERQHQPAFA